MNENQSVIIYGLIDPINQQCMYVGKTKGSMSHRLRGHINDAKRYPQIPRFRWINGLLKKGYTPEIAELEIVSVEEWQESEQFWISSLRFMGCKLLNGTAGGDGIHNHRHTEETKAKMSISAALTSKNPEIMARRVEGLKKAYANPELKKRTSDRLKISHSRPETIEKLRISAKRNANTPEARARTSRVHKGKTFSEETRRKISVAATGRKLTQETIKKMSDGHRGKKLSEETKQKMRDTYARKKAERESIKSNNS